MRIVIKEADAQRAIKLILPYHLCVNLAVRKSWVRLGLRHGANGSEAERAKWMAYLDAIDFGELRDALHQLSDVKGLVLVEVEDSDGTYVKIST